MVEGNESRAVYWCLYVPKAVAGPNRDRQAAFEAVILDYMQKSYIGEDTEVLEPFRRSGYLDAIKAFSEFSKAAIKEQASQEG
jgi:hypothetical protein